MRLSAGPRLFRETYLGHDREVALVIGRPQRRLGAVENPHGGERPEIEDPLDGTVDEGVHFSGRARWRRTAPASAPRPAITAQPAPAGPRPWSCIRGHSGRGGCCSGALA